MNYSPQIYPEDFIDITKKAISMRNNAVKLTFEKL